MNATRPEAETEYSRARQGSEGDSAPRERRSGGTRGGSSAVLWLVFLGGLIGAVLLLVAEFTPLFTIHSSAYGAPVRSELTGSHQTYALVPIALLAAALTVIAVRSRSRAALFAIGALGLVTLAIALLGDLPDAQATGIVHSSSGLATASSSPSTGLYLETLGAILLLLTAGAGLLLPVTPRRTPARRSTTPDGGEAL